MQTNTFLMTFRFQVYYMEDAYEFLKNLDDKARDKLLYNIERTIHRNDKTLFKKLNDDIWEFRTLYNKSATGFWLFGIKRIIITHW